MKRKTQQLIARIIVILLVALMIIGAVSPYIYGASNYVTYSSSKLHMEFRIPAAGKRNSKKVSSNAREFSINSHLTARVVYGDIYKEVLDQYKLDSSDLDRSEVYIESQYTTKTWNNETYIKKYFKSVFAKAKSKYSYTIDKTTLSGIPAWRCKYKGKKILSGGYYYLTVNNGGLYILQLDSYLMGLSKYKSTIKRIKDSYTITDLVIPSSDGSKTTTKKKTDTTKTTAKKDTSKTDSSTTTKSNTKLKIGLALAGFAVVLFGIIFVLIKYIRKHHIISKLRAKRIRNRKVTIKRKR